MRRIPTTLTIRLVPIAVLLFAVLTPLAPRASSGGAQTEGQLKVPDGFEVVLVAAPRRAAGAIGSASDGGGRPFGADSSGSNDKVDVQLVERTHRIVRLEDTNGDGRFDATKVFADRMMFPEGTMWFDGSLYVSAPPSIWKLTDTDDDGIADRREEWFQGKTVTGCANDLDRKSTRLNSS